MPTYNPITCHNCRFNVSTIDMSKLRNKCPRCGCGLFDNIKKSLYEKEKDMPNTGDNVPRTRGKPLIS